MRRVRTDLLAVRVELELVVAQRVFCEDGVVDERRDAEGGPGFPAADHAGAQDVGGGRGVGEVVFYGDGGVGEESIDVSRGR